jgi:hypothetical protein
MGLEGLSEPFSHASAKSAPGSPLPHFHLRQRIFRACFARLLGQKGAFEPSTFSFYARGKPAAAL